MRPAQVLDQQNDLVTRLGQRAFWQTTMSCFAIGLGVASETTKRGRDAVYGAAADFTTLMTAQVATAYAYHVSDDMSAVVDHAAQGLDDTDVYDLALAPTRSGIVYFNTPLNMTDARGGALKAHWMIWGPTSLNGEDGTLCTIYNDADDPDETDHDERDKQRAVMGRWSWIGSMFHPNGGAVGPPTMEPLQSQVAAIEASGAHAQEASNPGRYLHALWLLLGQPVAALTDADLTRADRKRIGRMPIPGKVSVVGLRRGQTSTRNDGESQVEWKHRWLVRGHWRWAPTGPLGTDLHEHRWGDVKGSVGSTVRYCQHEGCKRVLSRLWVNGHVKGPEGAPLVVTDKVYKVDR